MVNLAYEVPETKEKHQGLDVRNAYVGYHRTGPNRHTQNI